MRDFCSFLQSYDKPIWVSRWVFRSKRKFKYKNSQFYTPFQNYAFKIFSNSWEKLMQVTVVQVQIQSKFWLVELQKRDSWENWNSIGED